MPHLSPEQLHDTIDREQALTLAKAGPLSIAVSVCAQCSYAAMIWPHSNRVLIVSWLVVSLTIHFARAWMCRALRHSRPDTADCRRWRLRYSILTIASAASWGFAGSVLFPYEHFELYLTVGFLLVAIPPAALASLYAHWPTYIGYMFFTVWPNVLATVWSRQPGATWLCALTMTYTLLLLMISREVSRNFVRSLEQRFEIDSLVNHLETARDAAETANRAKSEFLAKVSHELRTPMNAVLGMSELLANSMLDTRQRKFTAAIHRSAEDLIHIINDILDATRAEAGRIELHCEDFEPRELIHDVTELLGPTAARKHLALHAVIDPQVVSRVCGDPIRLRQILINLAGNAIKFTDQGEVSIRVDVPSMADPWELRFEVHDTGVGIPAEVHDRLFRAFSQVDGTTTRRFGGTGLGLVISRQLVELMQGEIAFDSRPGEGSTFWFTVRLGPPTHVIEQQLPLRACATALRAPLKVLIVEDNEMNQEVALAMVDYLGHRAVAVSSAEDALRALEAATYDVVLMDVQMPDMDGYEATRTIRQQEALTPGRRIPIIALTANAGPEAEAACRTAGMDDFLVKPCKLTELAAHISTYEKAACVLPAATGKLAT